MLKGLLRIQTICFQCGIKLRIAAHEVAVEDVGIFAVSATEDFIFKFYAEFLVEEAILFKVFEDIEG